MIIDRLERPVAPFAATYVLGLVAAGLSTWVWEPFGYAAVVLAAAGCVGAAVVAAVLVSRRSLDVSPAACALAGSLTTGVLHVWGHLHQDNNSIGAGFVVILAWVLFGIGAAARSRRAT